MSYIFLAFLLLSFAAHAAERPNFLLILTDDHGYGDVSAYHPSDVRTANIDLRVPFMVRWPAQIKAGSRSDYAGLNFDLFPTFVELAGGKPAPDLDAVSLVPILRGGVMNQPRDLYFVRREGGPQYGGQRYEAIIRGDWKLMQNDPFSPLELYNLKADPQEKTNLAATNKKLVNELGAALRQHIQRGGATPWQKPVTP